MGPTLAAIIAVGACATWAAMALSRTLLQLYWSAMLRLTQGSLREVNLEPLLQYFRNFFCILNHL
ncbi:hypothetical protein BRN91_18985 [Xanthomonas oryzae pv. oryzae]|nr:hypothetical protein BRN91_18985 [Xanthomonas oryzae pv. oryzae]